MQIGIKQEEIFKDIDRLKICYQIKLYSSEKEDWRPYFHELSLDSHQNNQLFLDHHQLFSNHKPSIVLSGLALDKEDQIKEIYLVGDNCCILGEIGFASPALEAKLPNIKHSSNSRWRCALNFSGEGKQSFELIVCLSNNQKIIYKRIEIYLIKLSDNYQEINRQINSTLDNKIKSIYYSRRLMANCISQQKNYLFAIGNARSGTTALGRVLNSSPEICLGVERYSTKDNILASSFEQEAFFDSGSKNYLVRLHFYEVYLVKYEDFFVLQSKMIHLFNYLKIDPENKNVKKGMNKINQTTLKLKKKERILSNPEKKYISSYADFYSYNVLLILYEQQFAKKLIF